MSPLIVKHVILLAQATPGSVFPERQTPPPREEQSLSAQGDSLTLWETAQPSSHHGKGALGGSPQTRRQGDPLPALGAGAEAALTAAEGCTRKALSLDVRSSLSEQEAALRLRPQSAPVREGKEGQESKERGSSASIHARLPGYCLLVSVSPGVAFSAYKSRDSLKRRKGRNVFTRFDCHVLELYHLRNKCHWFSN